jgi:hypothetical protein
MNYNQKPGTGDLVPTLLSLSLFCSNRDRVVPHFTSAVPAARQRFIIHAMVPGPYVEPGERMWKRR